MATNRGPSSPFVGLARRIARQQGVPPSLLLALITAESGWNPEAGSSAGARGLTQLMPGTARGLGVRDLLDPEQNIRGGARYLRKQLDAFGSPELALSAYNSGPGGAESRGMIENFPETQAYVQKVMALEAQYRGAGGVPLDVSPAGMPPTSGAPGADTGAPMGGGGTLPLDQAEPGLPTQRELLQNVGPLTSKYLVPQIEQEQQAEQSGPGFASLPSGDYSDVPTEEPVSDGGQPAVGGLNAEFARRFKLLQAAVQQAGGELYIYSGGRDAEHQAQLYQAALRKYGSESEARKWVAPPGKSNHDTHAGLKYGLGDGAVASDLRGDLAMAHKLAAKYGLVFPLANEAWHIELAGIRNMR